MKYLSSKEVASIIGCNESTIRRWTDKGFITCQKTAGGHRYFTLQDIRAYYKKNNNLGKKTKLASSKKSLDKIYQLINDSKHKDLSILLAKSSIISDEISTNNIITHLYLYGNSVELIFDQIIEKSLDLIESWLDKGVITHSEDYVARKLITRYVESLCQNKPNGNYNGKNALCINFEDNLPDIGVVMSEVVLRHQGYNVFNAGSHAELGDLAKMINTHKLDLMIFYLCDRQCCNAISSHNLSKTKKQISQISDISNDNDVKVLFGGSGYRQVEENKNKNILSFLTYNDLLKFTI